MTVVLLIFLSSFIMGFQSRSVSVYVHHREKYEVKTEEERAYIELPDDVVKLLDAEAKPEDRLEIQLDQLTNAKTTNNPSRYERYRSDVRNKFSDVIKNSPSDVTISKDNKTSTINITDASDAASSKSVDVLDTPDGSFNPPDGEDYLFTADLDEEDDDNNEQEDEYDNSSDPESELTNTDDPRNSEEKPSLLSLDHLSNYDEIQNDDEIIDRNEGFRRHLRPKRQAGYQQWRHSLPGHQIKQTNEEDIEWEEITDTDLRKAKYGELVRTAEYVGITLLSVACFVFIGYCFIRDPVAFIFAFGTGCPCCIICCPCIRKFTDKYLNVKKIIRDSMNKYLPGVIIKDDGTFDTYEPTGEELAIMDEILNEIM